MPHLKVYRGVSPRFGYGAMKGVWARGGWWAGFGLRDTGLF